MACGMLRRDMLRLALRGCLWISMWLPGLVADSFPVPARAADTAPAATDLLFAARHLDNVAPGTELSYTFQRTVPEGGKPAGEPFSDSIRIVVEAVPGGGRQAAVQVFTGDRARSPVTHPGAEANPLLLFGLDRAVHTFQMLTGGSWAYLKHTFRSALRDKARVAPVTVTYEGRPREAYRITVTPYADDPNARRMHGYEGASFSFTVSDAIPGRFVEIVSSFESREEGQPRIEERITFAGAGPAAPGTASPPAETPGAPK